MDTSRPLWQMHYIPRCQGGGSALLVVINHALADGTTSVAILLDATVVRALLVPAFMRIAGNANWWAPAPLRRLHARLGVREG